MSTQLRLVEAPPRSKPPKGTGRPARAVPHRTRRAVRWGHDWRLDPAVRRAGRVGVAAARDALTRAADPSLPQAS